MAKYAVLKNGSFVDGVVELYDASFRKVGEGVIDEYTDILVSRQSLSELMRGIRLADDRDFDSGDANGSARRVFWRDKKYVAHIE